MKTILIIEDDISIARLIKTYVSFAGYEAAIAPDGELALVMLGEEKYNLVILDLMLPHVDGEMVLETIKKLRLPVIVVSAKSSLVDRVRLLRAGADDYITKPFGSMELLARVHSNLRRYEQILQLKKAASASQKETEEAHTLTAGGLELDLYTKQLTVDGKNVKLTPKEYAILELLMRSPGRVYSAEQIYENVWKEEAINTETIMVHVRKLREKIEVNPRNPRYLKVVWGIGYKIEK